MCLCFCKAGSYFIPCLELHVNSCLGGNLFLFWVCCRSLWLLDCKVCELRKGTLCQTRLIRSHCTGLADWFVLGLGTWYSFSPTQEKTQFCMQICSCGWHYAELVFLCSNKPCPLLEVKVHRLWMNGLLKFRGSTVLALGEAIKEKKESDAFRSSERSPLWIENIFFKD